jgi:NADH-quinone oxidoreductase subunit I
MAAQKKYTNPERLRFSEAIYLIEIIKGLGITGKVFFSNLWKWICGKRGAVTTYYPEEERPDRSPFIRGRHYLVQNPDGTARCVACYMCATVCPAHCIHIDAVEVSPDPDIQRGPERFDIDLSLCVMCGFCVEACPVDAIRMSDNVKLVGYTRKELYLDKQYLMTWDPHVEPIFTEKLRKAQGDANGLQ